MFFVYGTSGQLFRGTMEQLRQIHGVGALARSRRVAALGRDGHEVAEDLGNLFVPSGGAGSGLAFKEDASRLDPLAAYAQAPLAGSQRRPLSSVAEVMSRQVITLPAQASVQEAWALLAAKAIGQAPVVDENSQLVGLVMRADLLKPDDLPNLEGHVLAWRALMLQNIKEVMWTPVPSVAPDSDIRRVARVLPDTGLPGLPVVDEQGHVNGFISRSDILRAVVNDPPLDLWG